MHKHDRVAAEYSSGSPFGSNYRLPIVGLNCGTGADNISECQIYNQTSFCNHKKSIGMICKGNRTRRLYTHSDVVRSCFILYVCMCTYTLPIYYNIEIKLQSVISVKKELTVD